jgi:hypothetical protein
MAIAFWRRFLLVIATQQVRHSVSIAERDWRQSPPFFSMKSINAERWLLQSEPVRAHNEVCAIQYRPPFWRRRLMFRRKLPRFSPHGPLFGWSVADCLA